MANVKSKQGTRPNTFKNSKKKKKQNTTGKKQASEQRREKAQKTKENNLKKSGNARADERRGGAVRAQKTTVAKATRGAVEYVGQKHAQSVTKAFTSANKRAAETAGHGNRGKSGQVHAPTKSADRSTIKQVKASNVFKANEKKNRSKEESVRKSNYKGNAAVAAGRSATKKLEVANKKSLEMGASGFSNKKHSVNVPVLGKMEFSNKDIYKGSVKLGNEMLDYVIPYGGTAKGAIKAADAMVNVSKAARAGKALTKLGEKGGKELSENGVNVIKNAIKRTAKNGEKADMEALQKRILKSDLKDNIKRELLANAMQDATIGTGIDLAKGIEEGYSGKDLAKYMGENALLNVGIGVPISAIAGRTGKAGKAALKNEIDSVANQATKAVTEENRIARRLGAKGMSPEEVQKAISKREVQEYIDLSVKDGKTGLTIEQKKHLERLSTKVEAQKKAYDDAITESVKATRESIGKASAVDVARLRRAVVHYETTGNKSASKEARQLLAQAEKNFDNTLNTVTKAAANVSNALKREYKIESADEIIDAFAKTGGKVNDPSQFHGFAEFDKDGNIVGYHVNKDSEQALEYTFGHEFMHGFESLGKDYDNFVSDLKTFVGDEWDEAVEIAKRDYANVENADFEKEAVANLVAKHFFSEDSTYLKKLAGENPSMFAKIYNMIKKLFNGVSEHDAQFDALSKRMDEMFDSLSEKNKSIILGSPDTSEALFAGGRTLQELVDDGINAEVAQGLREDLKAAKESLLYAIKQSGGDYKEIAKARKQIYKDYGWFEGYDGKWRYEIDDSRMHYTLGKAIKTSVSNGKRLVFLDKNTGKIASASVDKVHEVETRLSELASKSKLTKKEANELQGLRTQMNLYLALTNPDGVPLGRVLTHDKFFELYPDAKDIKFKLSSSGDYADIKYDNVENATREAISFGGYNKDKNMLTLNANMFAADSNLSKYIVSTGKDPSEQIRRTTVHEMQHYIQDEEGFSRGANPEEYDYNAWEQFDNDAAATNSYPKNYERDAEALEKLTDEKADIEADIESKFGIDEYDDFRAKYLPYMRDMTDEDLQYLGKQGFVEQAYHDLTTGDDPITVVNKEHEQLIKEYFEKDYDASQLAERDPQKVYKQAAGEVEAEDVADRVNMSKSERKRNYPVQEGINIRYAEYPRSKGLAEKNLPKRKTKNETNLTRRSQTMSDSESAYYESLASDVEAAEREFQEAVSAYNPADSAPAKGRMTDEVKAQIKAQKLGGKELTDEQVETLAEAQVALHNTKVIIPESARGGTVKDIRARFGLAEDNMMLPIVKSSTAKNAQSVADGYAALSKEFPDLFPSSITDEAEQFRRLMDVSGLKGGAQSRRGNYYVPKNRTMTPYKAKSKSATIQKVAEQVAKADKANAEAAEASRKLTEAQKAKQQKPKKQPKAEEPKTEKPKTETPKEPTTEKNGMIDRERRENTKKRENETAKKAFKLLNDEYGKDQGWVDAVTGKREDGAFGKLKVKGAKEAEETAEKEFNDIGYDKLKQKYFIEEVTEDPYMAMARANKLLGEIDRRLKSGEGEPSELYDEATDIIEKYSGITTLGSNILSSAKKFLTSTPQGRKRVVLKEIERLEKRYKDRIKGGKLIIPEDKIDELMHATGARADELLDEINMELWNQIPASLMERMNEYRHCFMLFNVKTHGRNVIGNSIFRFARMLSDEMEQKILNSNYARTRIGKMQGGKDASDVIINKQHVSAKEIRDNIGYLENEFHAIYDKSGSRNKFIETGRPDGVPTVKFKLMQKAIDFNYSWLEKEDLKGALKPAFNKSYIGYCKARCAQKLEKDVSKVSGEELREFMENMTHAQKEKAQQYALAQGEYATFRDSCAFSDWLTGRKQTFAGKKGNTKWGTFGYRALDAVLEGALPFVKTPVNIFRRSVDFSPASLIMSLGKLARADSPEMFQLGVHQLCTGLTGTGVMGIGVFLANGGLFGLVEDATVQAGEVSGDAYYDRDMGYQDYSMVFNLGDKQYSWTLDWASPMNMSLFAGVAFKDAWDKRKEGIDNTTALNAFFAITSPITDMSFMSSPKDTVERFMENASRGGDGKETDFAGALAQLIVGDLPKNYVSGFFPQLMAQIAGASDEYRRDTKSTRENVYLKGWESSYRQIVNKIPWAREKLLTKKLDRQGKDVKNDENIGTRILNSFFNPANVREITTNETDRELIDIRNHIEDKNSNDYKYFYYNFTGNPSYDLANGKRMSYRKAYDYAKSNRIEQNERIKEMIDSPSYKGMTWKMKADEVDDAHWIGTSVADMETYGANYAMLSMLKNNEKELEPVKEYKRLTNGDGRKTEEVNAAYMKYYINKERLVSRSHATGDDLYRMKGITAIQTGDKALLKALDIQKSKVDDLTHYWERAKDKYGAKAKKKSLEKLSDGCCRIMSNCKYAEIENPSKGVKSVSAGMVAKGYTTKDGVKIKGDQIEEDVYRALGHNWNSAQSGGGLMLKYNKDGKYSIEKINEMKSTLRNQYDKNDSGSINKSEVIEYIDSLGIKSDDEKACLYEVIYNGGRYKNPYKSEIDDHLKWGENHDDEWGDGTGGRRRRGRGRGGWGHGGGGGGGGSTPFTPVLNTAGGAANQTITKAKVSNPFKASDYTRPSNLNDAYRKRVRKLRNETHKKR